MAKPRTETATPVGGGVTADSPFTIDTARPMAWAGGGLPTFAAGRAGGAVGKFIGIAAAPDAPTRSQAIGLLTENPAGGVMCPVWEGRLPGPRNEPAWFVVCPSPPGPALWDEARSSAPWTETELLRDLLLPASAALEMLQARGVTHRAIRPGNLFRAGPGEPVVLGPAWAAPSASLQPAVFEPPYVAVCPPAGRGDGSIADDVYALGVTILVLALGRVPLADLDAGEIVRRKLAVGSFEALAGKAHLPPAIADIVRGMLAEDPDHRPAPALLADPLAARARRVAARPPRRAQRPALIGGTEVWDARGLAHAIVTDPPQGLRFMREGADAWLRRSLGDAALAVRLEEIARQRVGDGASADGRQDPFLGMLLVAALDPLAPLVWNEVAFWPDGIGPLIAAGSDAETSVLADALRQLIMAEAIPAWIAARIARGDRVALRLDAQQHRSLLRVRGWGGGLLRLRYALNTTMRCASPLLKSHVVTRIADLLPAIEQSAERPEGRRRPPIDRHVGAFISARCDLRAEADLAALAAEDDKDRSLMLQLGLLAKLQTRQGSKPLPNLTAAFAEMCRPMLSNWQNRARRGQLDRKMTELATNGILGPLHVLLSDSEGRAADELKAAAAQAELARIDAELDHLRADAAGRAEQARSMGYELAACAGLMALSAMIVAAAVS